MTAFDDLTDLLHGLEETLQMYRTGEPTDDVVQRLLFLREDIDTLVRRLNRAIAKSRHLRVVPPDT